MWEYVMIADWINANWLWVLIVICSSYAIGYLRGYSRGKVDGTRSADKAWQAAIEKAGMCS